MTRRRGIEDMARFKLHHIQDFSTRARNMKRVARALALGLVVAATGGGSATADPGNQRASCEGILVSSASYPGEIAELGRLFHQQLKDQGIPPGFLDVGAAQVKAGSVDACLAVLPS